MEPLIDLTKGLEILKPFLERHGFALDNYKNGIGSGGQFTVATFKNGRKLFSIGYRFSIGELAYQFDNYQVGHAFYLDHLGLADKKQFPDFQSDDKLLAFRHILHDLDFLVYDFFDGSCDKLIEAAELQVKVVREFNEKAQEEYNNQFDQMKIDRARHKFKAKDYKGTLDIYNTVERKTLLDNFDNKTIEYCKRLI
jgi:dGTP triphosphohydrolase